MSTIGESHVKKVAEHVEHLFRDYLTDIDDAYLESDNDISITFTVKIAPHPNMANEEKVKTSIRFTPKATTDKIEEACSEHQGKLNFHQEASIETPAEPGAVKVVKDDEFLGAGEPEDLPGLPEPSTIQPNEHGVLDVMPIFQFATKKSQASITIFPWEGMWLHGSHADIQGGSGYGHPVSVNHERFASAEDALDAAKQVLIAHCERTIQDHPGKRNEVKKIIIWAENLSAAGIEPKSDSKDLTLEEQIEFLAQRVKDADIDAETAGGWFNDVAGQVIAAWFPQFDYIKPREILTWVDNCAAAEGVPVIDDLRDIMASMEGYKHLIFRYIEEHDLQPQETVEAFEPQTGEAAV